MAHLPKWATPNRQTYLIKLWVDYGNKCLLGHTTCPIPSHYVYNNPKGVKVATPIKIACRDSEGNLLLVDDKPIYLTAYAVKSITVYEQKVARLYELKSEQAIKSWKADDQQHDIAEWQEERKRLHSLAERRYPLRGQFSNIGKDIFFGRQPLFYLEALGMSGLTLQPFAKVKIASSYFYLYIDLGDSLRGISKNKRRKAIRYGKQLPTAITERIAEKVSLAVRDYLH